MRKIQNILAHTNIVFVGVFLTLWVINTVNPKMQFLSSGITNIFLLLFCLSALALAILCVLQYRHYQKMQYEKAVAAARAKRMGQAPVRPPRR
ncbi:MAG: hypothetical protein RRZ24_08990 [Clostridia bacterium]